MFFFKVEPTYSCLWLLGMGLHWPCPYSSPLVPCYKKTPFALRHLLGLNSRPFSMPRQALFFPPSFSWDSSSSYCSPFSIAVSLYPFLPLLCPLFGVLPALPLVWPNTPTFVFKKFLGSILLPNFSSLSETTWPFPPFMDVTHTFLRSGWPCPWLHPVAAFVISTPFPLGVPSRRHWSLKMPHENFPVSE